MQHAVTTQLLPDCSPLLRYSPPAADAAAAAFISSSSTISLHCLIKSLVVWRISSTAASALR